jgi:NADH:ubiquinone oxidoreductase subunit C
VTNWLPDDAERIFGAGASADDAYELLTVDVPAGHWVAAVTAARDELDCAFFDWLSAVDEPDTGFRVCVHLVALPAAGTPPRRLLLRTTVPHAAPAVESLTGVFAGAGWHERETHEMFGIDFSGHQGLAPLLLPDGFEGHPLRKDFVLAARVVKAWPGAKEPGESEHGGPKRRQMQPPGVPDPNEWGPLKGQVPPAPTRRRAAGAAAADRPARRTRPTGGTAGAASAEPPAAGPEGGEGEAPPKPARRARSASEGSASRRRRSAAGTTDAVRSAGEDPAEPASPGAGAAESARAAGAAPAGRRSTDAPWHDPRPSGEASDNDAGDGEAGDADAGDADAGDGGSEPKPPAGSGGSAAGPTAGSGGSADEEGTDG